MRSHPFFNRHNGSDNFKLFNIDLEGYYNFYKETGHGKAKSQVIHKLLLEFLPLMSVYLNIKINDDYKVFNDNGDRDIDYLYNFIKNNLAALRTVSHEFLIDFNDFKKSITLNDCVAFRPLIDMVKKTEHLSKLCPSVPVPTSSFMQPSVVHGLFYQPQSTPPKATVFNDKSTIQRQNLSDLLETSFEQLPPEFKNGLEQYYKKMDGNLNDAKNGWNDNSPETRVQLLYRVTNLGNYPLLTSNQSTDFYNLNNRNWENASIENRKTILKEFARSLPNIPTLKQ